MGSPAETGRAGDQIPLHDVGQATEDVLRYRVEIERRLGAAGVSSIGDVLATFERLREATQGLSLAELGWMRERVNTIVARVEAYATELTALRQLKRRIGG